MPTLEMERTELETFNRPPDGLSIESKKPLYIMKFGGTSVGNFRAIERTSSIIENYIKKESSSIVVVVSAASGITDRLLQICNFIQEGDTTNLNDWTQDILSSHFETLDQLNFPSFYSDTLRRRLGSLYQQLRTAATNFKSITPENKDLILSFGERFNSHIVAAKLSSLGLRSEAIDASEIVETDNNFGEAQPDFEKTKQYTQNKLLPLIEGGVTPVVTGFIGATKDYHVTTLGRGGSDYTASILGRVLDADEVWIWTDVDGVFDKDPRHHPDAQILPQLSKEKANQMAEDGAKVLYSKTIKPLMGLKTTVRVKNTFEPALPGTLIL